MLPSNLVFTIIPLLFILNAHVSTTVMAAQVDSLCGLIVAPSMSKEQCLAFYSLDPRSSQAQNYHELGQIIVDILISRVSKLERSISDAKKDKPGNPDVQSVLEACSSLYMKGNPTLQKVRQEAKAKDYHAATDDLLSYFNDINGACVDQINKVRELPSGISAGAGEVTSINYCALMTEKKLASL